MVGPPQPQMFSYIFSFYIFLVYISYLQQISVQTNHISSAQRPHLATGPVLGSAASERYSETLVRGLICGRIERWEKKKSKNKGKENFLSLYSSNQKGTALLFKGILLRRENSPPWAPLWLFSVFSFLGWFSDALLLGLQRPTGLLFPGWLEGRRKGVGPTPGLLKDNFPYSC